MPTALVADDSAVARLTVSRALGGAGFQIVSASSLADGRTVDPTALAVAIIDLDLGDGSGIDLVAALRAKRSNLPIAFFSGGADDEALRAAATMGPVFAKPSQLDDLVAWARRSAFPDS